MTSFSRFSTPTAPTRNLQAAAIGFCPWDGQAGSWARRTEAAFQLSFKFRLWATDDRRWSAWAAYTQQSHWQLHNDSGNASRPLRETNYMPELILS